MILCATCIDTAGIRSKDQTPQRLILYGWHAWNAEKTVRGQRRPKGHFCMVCVVVAASSRRFGRLRFAQGQIDCFHTLARRSKDRKIERSIDRGSTQTRTKGRPERKYGRSLQFNVSANKSENQRRTLPAKETGLCRRSFCSDVPTPFSNFRRAYCM